MADLSQLLQSYPTCPMCDGLDRDAVPNTYSPNRYLLKLGEWLDTPPEKILAQCQMFQCRRCGTTYSDPWLSITECSNLYNIIYPQHNMGWVEFYKWMLRPTDQATLREINLLTMLHEFCGTVDRYSELNCPFVGLLPLMHDLVSSDNEKNLYFERVFQNAKRNMAHPHSQAQKTGIWQQMLRSAGRQQERVDWSVYQRAASPTQAHGLTREKVPANRCFLIEPTVSFWSMNCASQHLSCAGASASILGAPVLTIEDCITGRNRFDVIGLYYCLDHFLKPLAVLKRLLTITNHVFVETHRKGGRQHQYTLDPEPLIRFLVETGFSVQNTTSRFPHLNGDGFSFLLTAPS